MEPVWIIVVAGAVVLMVVLLLLGRRRERVIDMGAPDTAETGTGKDTPAGDAAKQGQDPTVGARSAGEILEVKGKDDAECGLADWLMLEANRALGVDLSSDHMAMTRLAEAALKASADLKATGRASIDLPYLVADARGPKHFQRVVTRQEAEPGMIEHGALLVDEVIQWRGGGERAVALAEWLESEADEEAGEGNLDPAARLRLADATERALADIARAGRAVVDLPALTRDGGSPFHFRREFDRATLSEMIGDE